MGHAISGVVSEAGVMKPTLGIQREHPSGAVPNTHQERFGMIPWEVLVDPRLKHADIRVYGVMASCRRGSDVNMGTRLIARHGCMGQTTVIESLRRLKVCGYAESCVVPNGARAEYRRRGLGPAGKCQLLRRRVRGPLSKRGKSVRRQRFARSATRCDGD
jgi:hypothetical protein